MKNMMFIMVLLVVVGCASSMKTNQSVNTENWKKIAIMPFQGGENEFANNEITYALSTNSNYEFIIPSFFEGDVIEHTRKYRLKTLPLTSMHMIARKYQADAYVVGEISKKSDSLGVKATVSIKVIDTSTSQVFAMSIKEGFSIFNEEELIKELIIASVNELDKALSPKQVEAECNSWFGC